MSYHTTRLWGHSLYALPTGPRLVPVRAHCSPATFDLRPPSHSHSMSASSCRVYACAPPRPQCFRPVCFWSSLIKTVCYTPASMLLLASCEIHFVKVCTVRQRACRSPSPGYYPLNGNNDIGKNVITPDEPRTCIFSKTSSSSSWAADSRF